MTRSFSVRRPMENGVWSRISLRCSFPLMKRSEGKATPEMVCPIAVAIRPLLVPDGSLRYRCSRLRAFRRKNSTQKPTAASKTACNIILLIAIGANLKVNHLQRKEQSGAVIGVDLDVVGGQIAGEIGDLTRTTVQTN